MLLDGSTLAPDELGPRVFTGAGLVIVEHVHLLSDALARRLGALLDERRPWFALTGPPQTELTAEQRAKTSELLRISENKIPATCWLTEFEDDWSYTAAPADVLVLAKNDFLYFWKELCLVDLLSIIFLTKKLYK